MGSSETIVTSTVEQSQQPDWLNRYVNTYNQLTAQNLNTLANIYSDTITFVDPVHEINGLANLKSYFENLYLNMNTCQFEITNTVNQGDQAAIYWTMTFSHKKIKSGETLTVDGHSLLNEKDGFVVYQRDYFDVASMVYEHVPLVGNMVRFIKKRIG